MDGLSIVTLGNPHKHVWTYAVGFSEVSTGPFSHYCSCATARGGRAPPSFVDDHYYCESGYAGTVSIREIFYTCDPLWDGIVDVFRLLHSVVLMSICHGSLGNSVWHNKMILRRT